MKTKRNLSGIYFRSENKDTGKWENTCFEDLTRESQDEQLSGRNEVWLRSMVRTLANTINKIGEQFNIMSD